MKTKTDVIVEKHPDGGFLLHTGANDAPIFASATEALLKALYIPVVKLIDPTRIDRWKYVPCEVFLSMYPHAAKAIYGLSDDGYLSWYKKAELILSMPETLK